jgi:LacI family transcriptional regulator
MLLPPPTASAPHVVILTSTIPKGLHEMLQGVLQYAQERGPWRIYQQENRRWMYRLQGLKQWGCTGIVAADHHSEEEARLIAGVGVPVVVLLQPHPMRRPSYPLFPHSCVLWDSAAVGRMAADYFIERRYTRFAFVGDTASETYWSKEREHGFRKTLRAAGHRICHAYGPCSARERRDWAAESPRMQAWLKALPKPVGLFAPNDRRGKQVLDACLDAGISVPDEVAVLGVDNDEWICEASVPTLSSVQCDPRQAGFQIAGHLDRLMRGERLRKRAFIVPPVRVVTRQSTDWMAIADKQIARALTFIRERASDSGLRVNDLARLCGLSRRATEIRFKNATGRTVREEIEHVRLGRLRALLVESDERIGGLARQCGFGCQTHLGRVFRARYGVTMGQFRADARKQP